MKNQYESKKNLSKILINFMKIYKKKFSNEKSIHDSKKEKSFENTHKLHKNSKTCPDVQNELHRS